MSAVSASVPVYINALGVSCALGADVETVRANAFATRAHPLTLTAQYSAGRVLPLGCVPEPLPALAHGTAVRWLSRNNQLLQQALLPMLPAVQAAMSRFGPQRIAVVLGASTSGVLEGERAARHRKASGEWPADYDYAVQEMSNGAEFVAHYLGLAGVCHAISTACSSSAKAMASAARLLRSGLADAVITGGVDALCGLTVEGFSALESVAGTVCQPMSANRNGINIGEGAALFLMSREEGEVRLAGWGETSDAHHMSAPDPSGWGAQEAMRQALQRGGIAPRQVDYINMHGTATLHNDAMESLAIANLFGLETAVSSTKPLTGHALAAAGAIEAVLSYQTLVGNPTGALLPHWWDGVRDSALATVHLVQPGETLGRPARWVLSNSFAFGGSNASLLFARE